MAVRSTKAKIKKGVHTIDDLFYLFTGVRGRKVGARVLNLAVDYLKDKMSPVEKREEQELDDWYLSPDNPYRTLGVYPDTLDLVVKAAFRSLVREYHPDTGLHPDPKKFTAVVDAYNAIMSTRAEARKEQEHPKSED